MPSIKAGRQASSSALAEPTSGLLVPIDDRVLAAVEDNVEIAPVHRLFGPPAIDDAPLFTNERDRPAVHLPRRPVEVRLDESRPGSV
jgi:hypothetical protein